MSQAFAVSNLLYPETLDGKIVRFTAFSKFAASVEGGTLATGVSGVRYRVHAMAMFAASAGRVQLWGDQTVMFNAPVAANGQLVVPWSPVGWCQGSHGQSINLWTDVALTVTGVLIYVEV
jgi:hypothetical protein